MEMVFAGDGFVIQELSEPELIDICDKIDQLCSLIDEVPEDDEWWPLDEEGEEW